MAKLPTPAPTATCPQCGAEAKWNGSARYVCRATKVMLTDGQARGSSVHGLSGFSFVGDSGYCAGEIIGDGRSSRSIPCDKPGKPEPETMDVYDYQTRAIVQLPTTDRWNVPCAGVTYCGIHSPSKKAAKKAAEAVANLQMHEARKTGIEWRKAQLEEDFKLIELELRFSGLDEEAEKAWARIKDLAEYGRTRKEYR